MQSTLTTKSQVTIPKEIRDALKIGPGDKVKFFVTSGGSVHIVPQMPVTSLKGMLRSKKSAPSLEEMEKAIAKGGASRYKRQLGK